MSDQSKGYEEDVLFAVSDPQIGAKKPLTGAEQEALEDAAARNIAKPTVTIGDKTLPVESVTIDFKQETSWDSFVMPDGWYELPQWKESGESNAATNIPNVQMSPGPHSVEIRNEWGPAWQNAEIPDDVTHDGNGSLAPIMLSGKRVMVYLAGPMSSLPGFGFDRFDAARDNLIINGYKVISPADIDREIGFDPSVGTLDDFDLPAAIRRDVDAILGCDAVVLLPGHESSKGATAERYVAKWAGIPCYTYPDLKPYEEKVKPLYHSLFDRIGYAEAKQITDDEAGSVLVPEELTQATLDYDETFPTGLTKGEKDILLEAYEVTRGDRQNSYGPPDQDFRRTADMWTGLFRDMLKDGVSFEPFHVAQAMILLKMSRQLHQRKRDNWTDTAGYARCGQICDEAAKAKQ